MLAVENIGEFGKLKKYNAEVEKIHLHMHVEYMYRVILNLCVSIIAIIFCQ